MKWRYFCTCALIHLLTGGPVHLQASLCATEEQDESLSPLLPPEIQMMILSHASLTTQDQANCRRVCTHWKSSLNDEWLKTKSQRQEGFRDRLDIYRAHSTTFVTLALPGFAPDWRHIVPLRLKIAQEIFLEAFAVPHRVYPKRDLIDVAANLGDENAIFLLIQAYWKGNYGCPQNSALTRDLIIKFAGKGSETAKGMLRDGQELGLYGFPKSEPSFRVESPNVWSLLFGSPFASSNTQ